MNSKNNSRNKGHTNRLNVRLNDECLGKLDYICEKDGMSKSDFIRSVIETHYKIALYKK